MEYFEAHKEDEEFLHLKKKENQKLDYEKIKFGKEYKLLNEKKCK